MFCKPDIKLNALSMAIINYNLIYKTRKNNLNLNLILLINFAMNKTS